MYIQIDVRIQQFNTHFCWHNYIFTCITYLFTYIFTTYIYILYKFTISIIISYTLKYKYYILKIDWAIKLDVAQGFFKQFLLK